MGTTGIAWPVDAVTGVPSYTGRLLRQTLSVLAAGATTARPFGGLSGVRPNTSAATITATSTTWTGGLFGGIIDGEASNLSGLYAFAFNQVTSGPVTASNASLPRIDTISVQISDPAEGDLTAAPLCTLVYTTGTPLASPAVPPAPARAFIIAQLTFTAGTGTTPTVAWVAPNTVAAGGVIPSSTYAYLDTTIPATAGQLATVYADGTPAVNNAIYRSNGTQWVRAVPQIATFGYTGAGLANGNAITTQTVSQKSYAQTAIVQLVGAITASASATAAIGISVSAGGTLNSSTTQLVAVDTTQKRDGAAGSISVAAGTGTVTITFSAATTGGAVIAVSGVGVLTLI